MLERLFGTRLSACWAKNDGERSMRGLKKLRAIQAFDAISANYLALGQENGSILCAF